MATWDPAGLSGARPRRRSRRKWLTILAGVLAAVLVLAYAGVSYAVYDGLSAAKGGCWPEAAANTPQQFTVDAKWGPGLAQAYAMPKPQDVTFRSRDAAIANTQLAAWWIPATGVSVASAPAVVVVHGIKSCRREASILMAAGMLHKHGYSVFIMDMRNHGDSGFDADHRVATGTDEHLDILGGWDWVRSQGIPANRIGITAFSFGSGVAVIAGGQESGVQAVWADSSYTTTQRAMGLFLTDQTGMPDLLVPGAIVWGKINSIDFTKYDPITEVTHYSGRYLAFVHGANDQVLPAEMSTTLHDTAVGAGARVADTWIVSGARHTESIYRDPAGYEARLVTFFGQALGEPAA